MTSLIDILSPCTPRGESPVPAVGEPRAVVETYEWGRRMVRELEAFLGFALSTGAAAVTSRRLSPKLSAYPSPEAKPCC
jgi:hypothetical protein